jgi:hypothetical protein
MYSFLFLFICQSYHEPSLCILVLAEDSLGFYHLLEMVRWIFHDCDGDFDIYYSDSVLTCDIAKDCVL